MTRPAQVDKLPQKRGGKPNSQQEFLFDTGDVVDVCQVLRYTPMEGLPASAQTAPSCRTCRNQNKGCRLPCEDIKKLLANDHTARGRREFTNERDLDSHTKLVAVPSSRDFSRLLEVPHIFTPRQLAALRLLHEGKSRPQVCQILHVSNARISQLVKGAMTRYERYQARLRALTALELKEHGVSLSEERD